tara:strand:+ start:5778 stop:6326 length:549 start_codon:yes stop_codon:yes gene_type:complete
MSEAIGNPEGSSENVGQEAQSTQSADNVDYKALYHEEVENAKKQRHAKQDLTDQLSKFQKDQETAKVRSLKEQEKYQELAEELQKKVDVLSPFKEKYEVIETETRNSLLEQLPEEDREELAGKDTSTIRLFVNKFNNQKPSNADHIPGRGREVISDKPWGEMTDAEKRVFYEKKAQVEANRR